MTSFLKNLREIYDGWRNDLFPTEEILEMAEPRARICASCPLNVNGICSPDKEGVAVKTFTYNARTGDELREKGKTYKGCACPIAKKSKSPNSKCPLGKW